MSLHAQQKILMLSRKEFTKVRVEDRGGARGGPHTARSFAHSGFE